jgi:heme-degrading monooxygenase HmoA
MAQLFVYHKVEDYAKWRIVYDSADSTRRSFGMTGARVFHTTTSPNEVVIITDWSTADQARAYSQSPELRQAMQNAGVISQPEVLILEEFK